MAINRLLHAFKLLGCFFSPGSEKERRLQMAPAGRRLDPGGASVVPSDDGDRVPPHRRVERIPRAVRNPIAIEEDPAAAAAEKPGTLGPIEAETLPEGMEIQAPPPEGGRNRPIALDFGDPLIADVAFDIAIMESLMYQQQRSECLPVFECEICVESKAECEVFQVPGCSHKYCTECIGRHIAAKVEENVVAVGCPFPGCGGGSLKPEACKLILPPEVFSRWGKALCEAAISEPDKFYCPFGDCSALLIADGNGGERPRDAVCPHCKRCFCARCRVPWHEGVDCEQYQKLEEGERGKDDLLLFKQARDRKWQRCPKCRALIDRIEGCVFIKCRCHHCFCYRCGSTIAGAKHYCPKCQLTWERQAQPPLMPPLPPPLPPLA